MSDAQARSTRGTTKPPEAPALAAPSSGLFVAQRDIRFTRNGSFIAIEQGQILTDREIIAEAIKHGCPLIEVDLETVHLCGCGKLVPCRQSLADRVKIQERLAPRTIGAATENPGDALQRAEEARKLAAKAGVSEVEAWGHLRGMPQRDEVRDRINAALNPPLTLDEIYAKIASLAHVDVEVVRDTYSLGPNATHSADVHGRICGAAMSLGKSAPPAIDPRHALVAQPVAPHGDPSQLPFRV